MGSLALSQALLVSIWAYCRFLLLRLNRALCFQPFDRELAALLPAQRIGCSSYHSIGGECRILLLTIIYRQIGLYEDRNFRRLVQIPRHIPLFPVPSDSGLRQPIYASQLPAVSFHLARLLATPGLVPDLRQRIPLGGNASLSYESMIRALQKAHPASDLA